ncbi:MAG: Unknown protein [uncultured Sulfurovum sp.]|uniref:Uncharacterized protein n=1 Tax=uncultured Sulfurovum sp. TaxID=269237 RepID=A0A6S6TFV0_9BACT|nr:MAG: Unknown protein [uncultured Sulfurovum sp.]
MLKNREELESFYKGLTENFEGYIQMSDSRINDVFVTAISLPKWETLHKDTNYILEMALFDSVSNNSILVRQHNSEWLVLEKELNGTEPIDTFFTIVEHTPKMKIAQVWEEESNEFCLDMQVLEAKYLMFVGFEKGESK